MGNWVRTIAVLLAALFLLTSGTALAGPAKKGKGAQAGSVRVYRFDNLDVEGNVKTPQLMYFLKRIRKRFRSFRLPQQNFSRKILEAKEESDFL